MHLNVRLGRFTALAISYSRGIPLHPGLGGGGGGGGGGIGHDDNDIVVVENPEVARNKENDILQTYNDRFRVGKPCPTDKDIHYRRDPNDCSAHLM